VAGLSQGFGGVVAGLWRGLLGLSWGCCWVVVELLLDCDGIVAGLCQDCCWAVVGLLLRSGEVVVRYGILEYKVKLRYSGIPSFQLRRYLPISG
jgi:hypothetical protein